MSQPIEIVVRITVEVVKPEATTQVAQEPKPATKVIGKENAEQHDTRLRVLNYLTSRGTKQTVDRILKYYLVHHPQSRPGEPARRRIRDRMREGFSEQQCLTAIDGCHRSPHHCGENDRQTKYQSLDLIFRDSDHVQKFVELADLDPAKTAKSKASDRAADDFLRRHAESTEIERQELIQPKLLEAHDGEWTD